MRGSPKSVTVRVPASTSNCGAGFDTLGLALCLYNRVTVSAAAGVSPIPARASDRKGLGLVKASAAAFFSAAGMKAAGFRYRISGNVPAARGLGSSVTIIGGILAGLNVLHGSGMSRRKLVALATEVEGHPDNASAGILGGFCVSRCHPTTGECLATIRKAVPARLSFVVASPGIELLTKESRAALPAKLPYFDAVRSINAAAFFTAAMISGEYWHLHHSGGDFMHEPYRLPRIPGAAAAIRAGVEAGARVGWLSGSGSSILCVCARPAAAPAASALRRAFAKAGVKAKVRILAADNRGIVIE